MAERTSQSLVTLIRFLLKESDLLRSPAFLFVLIASGSRTALIFLINQTAEQGGGTLWMVSALIGVAGVMLFSTHQARMAGQILVQRLARKMRAQNAEKLLRADVRFFQTRDISKVYQSATTHVDMVSGATLQVLETAQAALLLVFVLIYMLIEMPASVMATVVALGLGVVAFVINQGPAMRALRDHHKASEAYHGALNDLMRGYKELRLRRARRRDLEAEIDTQIGEVQRLTVLADRHYSFGMITASGALTALLIAIVVVLPVVAGADSVTMLQILTLVLFSFAPIEAVISTAPRLLRAGVSFGLYRDLTAALSGNEEDPDPEQADRRRHFQTIELRGITSHLSRDVGDAKGATDRFTLGPVDLVLSPGQSVFITGGNGMGKSTLLSLLTGLRHADEGEILVDGVPVTRASISDYRSLFSAVFSEFYVFNRLYGMDAAEQERLLGHVTEMGIAGGVAIDAGAFTNLALSTGQLRRLALSMALAETRPIIVLDEFAADQDPGRRRFFYDVLVPRLAAAGHCVVAVTHDEHCFDKADRLIRMEDGKIVADIVQSESARRAP